MQWHQTNGMLVPGYTEQPVCHHLHDPLWRSEQLGARAEAEEEAARFASQASRLVHLTFECQLSSAPSWMVEQCMKRACHSGS